MNINNNLYIALILSVVFFFTGNRLSKHIQNKMLKKVLAILFFILCVPSITFLIPYDMLLGRMPVWYIEFRSINYIEVIPAFWLLFTGFIVVKDDNHSKIRWKIFNKYFYILCILMVLSPFLSSIFCLAVPKDKLQDQWNDNVCMQSTGYTCAPASLATIFKFYGVNKTEAEMVKACYTDRVGTDFGYVLRYARNNGLQARCYNYKSLSEIPVPSIFSTIYFDIPHAITLIGKKDNKYIIGDPINGKLELSEEEFGARYKLKGEGIYFYKPDIDNQL